MRQEHKYFLGKHQGGECYITWTLKDGEFSMCAERWLPSKRDVEECGQCVDRIASYFPHNLKASRMVEVWKRWHLNDLKAGSPAQEAYLRNNPVKAVYPESHYDKACAALEAVGLNPDPNYMHDGKPYSYGHAWLREEIPAEIVAEIQSWSAQS